MKFLAAFVLLALSISGASGQEPPSWPHHGVFGTFDRASLQRGYQVYKEVCASCHSMRFMKFRNLEGIGLSEKEISLIAASYTVQDGPDDQGDYFDRPGRAYDPFPSPFPNDEAARAVNGGALPPDLSLIIKAREGHEDYVYSLLNGYQDPPADLEVPAGLHYNSAYKTDLIAMAAPLTDDIVTYKDRTPATVNQMAYDVVNFLAWAGEPFMEERKRLGLKVILYLSIMALLLLLIKNYVWSKLD